MGSALGMSTVINGYTASKHWWGWMAVQNSLHNSFGRYQKGVCLRATVKISMRSILTILHEQKTIGDE